MAIAHSANTNANLNTNSGGSTTNVSHTQTGTPAGVLIFTIESGSRFSSIQSITYGGVSVPGTNIPIAYDSIGEPGNTVVFFLGGTATIPSGNQTVSVVRSGNQETNEGSVVICTVTVGTGNIAVIDESVNSYSVLINNGTITEQSLTADSSALDAIRYAGLRSGRPSFGSAASDVTVGANSTNLYQRDLGSRIQGAVRETTPGTGSRNVGWECTSGDDRGIAHVTIIEQSGATQLEAVKGTFTFTGNDATFEIGKNLSADVLALSVTGNDATFLLDFNVHVDPGAFILTGQAANLLQDKQLDAEVASFAVTGNDAGLHVVTNLDAEVASFALTGNDATFTQTRAIAANAGSFALTGQDVTFVRTWNLSAEAGAFTLTGNAAALTTTGAFEISPVVGSFSLTGNDATLRETEKLEAATGSFTFSGNDVTLTVTPVGALQLNAQVGSFTLTGNDATLLRTWNLAADAGSFSITGQPDFLRKQSLIVPVVGTFAVTGNDTALADFEILGAAAGTYAFTGNDVTLSVAVQSLDASIGSFVLTGNTIGVERNYVLSAETATFRLRFSSKRRNVFIF